MLLKYISTTIVVLVCTVYSSFAISVEDDYSTGYLQYRVGAVTYGAADCGHMSRYVLQNLSDDAAAGVFSWEQMNNESYRRSKLNDECNRLRNEVNYRQYNHNREFPRQLYDN